MTNKIVAVVPVREGSQRIKGKNFIEFADGRSLLDIKIDHLKEAGCFDHIYVSSDSERVKGIAEKSGVEFLNRESKYCQADVLLSEVFEHIYDTIPGNPVVVWALATSPLFCRFREAVDKFMETEGEKDSLVAVLPKKSFFLNEHGRGINFNPGWWHPYSQQLDTYYEVTGACYIGLKSDLQKWSYWFGVKPRLFEVSNQESVDVDTPQDFALAQKIYQALHSNANIAA